jgi:hypothetical protein
VLSCLAGEPDRRPRSAATLARELAAASPDAPSRELPPETEVRATEVTLRLTRPDEQPPAAGRTRAALTTRAVAAVIAGAVVITIATLLLIAPFESGRPGGQVPEARSAPGPSDPAKQARELADWVERRTGR